MALKHNFCLYPDRRWLANSILSSQSFPTSLEQRMISLTASSSAQEAYLNGDHKADEFYQEMKRDYSNPDPIRDLTLLQRGPSRMNITQELNRVKQFYNETMLKLIAASPEYMDLTWQSYRRMGYIEYLHSMYESSINNILNPQTIPTCQFEDVIPLPRTDKERVKQILTFRFNREQVEQWKQPIHPRLVEFDPTYFYHTGRYAFANSEGDIIQTIWDLRLETVPLFKLNTPQGNQ